MTNYTGKDNPEYNNPVAGSIFEDEIMELLSLESTMEFPLPVAVIEELQESLRVTIDDMNKWYNYAKENK